MPNAADCRPNENGWYQTEPEAYTALLLARIHKDRQPDFVIPHFGQEAYENYAAALYLRELMDIRRGKNICGWPGFPYLYAAVKVLLAAHDRVELVEVGSTLFATIDKLRKCEGLFGPFRGDGRLAFRGIEISSFLSQIAVALHPGETMTFADAHRPGDSAGEVSVGRCYQASSYAFDSTSAFADWVASLRFSLQGAWFSPVGGDRVIDGMGKRITLFDYQEFVDRLTQQGVRVHHMRSDRYGLRDGAFVASWLLTERFDDRERDAFCAECLNTPGLNADGVISGESELSSPLVSSIADAGPHAGGIDPDPPGQPLQSPLTFDFGSTGLEAKFSEHLASLHEGAAPALTDPTAAMPARPRLRAP